MQMIYNPKKVVLPPRDEPFFRHEFKYYINELGRVQLRKRLQLTMDRDKNVKKDGGYHIRSLYFDDLKNSAMQEKLAGVETRKKYRLRIYNFSDGDIKLECKEKQGSFIRKRSALLSREAADAMIAGRGIPQGELEDPLCREVQYLIQGEGLRPAVVVDYHREPFVAPYQNIRITLDRQLQCGLGLDIFDPVLPVGLVLEQGISILEVKFNDFLPAYFRGLIGGIDGLRSAASKYTLCRQYRDM